MMYKVDKNMMLYEADSNTHVPSGFKGYGAPADEYSMIYSPQGLAESSARATAERMAAQYKAQQASLSAQAKARAKANYENQQRQLINARNVTPISGPEQLIKREVMRQKMNGADFDEFEQIPGQNFTTPVNTDADFIENRTVNPSYANINASSNGVATVTDWPKRVPTQMWNQPVAPPNNVMLPLPSQAYKAATGLGDIFDDIGSALSQDSIDAAASNLSATGSTTATIPQLQAAGAPAIPSGIFGTLFPGYVTLPLVGTIPEAYIAYAGLGILGVGAAVFFMRKKK